MSVRGQPSMLNTANGDALALRVDRAPRRRAIAVCTSSSAMRLREIVAADRVLVDVVGHHAGHQVVRLVEEHRLPGPPEDFVIGRRCRASCSSTPSFSAVVSSRSSSRVRCFSSMRLL